ncbi:7148_t:CDS:2, partial [Funneliformis geosporum]
MLSQSNFEQVTNASSENMYHVTNTPQQENLTPSYQSSQTNSFGNPQYHVSCEKISNELIIKLLNLLKENRMQLKQNEYVFFYQQQCNDQIYQVSCEMVSPSLINNYLNKNIHGIEIENMGQE